MDYRISDIDRGDIKSISKVKNLLRSEGIDMDAHLDYTCAIYNEEYEIIATGSSYKNTLRCFAVDRRYQGKGLLNVLVGYLIQRECEQGYTHLFVYTKPSNRMMFESLGFHEIVTVDGAVLFMENRKNGLWEYIRKLEKSTGESAAIVMNANPFTLGHQYLVEKASKENKTVHLFMISEDESDIPFSIRKQLIMQGTAHLKNVIYHETGDYIISNATFPGYFFKDTDAMVLAHARLDVAVFINIAAALNITKRYVGDEPIDATTATYNNVLKFKLDKAGIECIIVPRKKVDNEIISATKVRELLKEKNNMELKKLVPASTYNYFINKINWEVK